MSLKLSLGPVLYYWPKEKLLDFYDEIISSPVDIVYLGETICSRRRSMRADEWLDLAQRISDAGKEVVLSTMALIEAGSELSTARRICEQHEFMVEANDIGAVQMRTGKGEFVAGHSVNIYNHHTLDLLSGLGMKRWVMPVELSRDTLNEILKQKTLPVETEIFAFGRLPLAYSARCYTARAHDLPKDNCEFRCLDYEDGMLLKTREDEKFLTLNGIQTQSSCVFNLVADLDNVMKTGVNVLRISPQSRHTPQIIQYFSDAISASTSSGDARHRINELVLADVCDGYWYGKPGMDQVAEDVV
jgi:collagenase-like PrtC family protease